MSQKNNKPQPAAARQPRRNNLGEINGYPVNSFSPAAKKARKNNWCPFMDRGCPKANGGRPLPSCAIYHEDKMWVTCPERFRDARSTVEPIIKKFFGMENASNVEDKTEVRLEDASGDKVGNMDRFFVATNDQGLAIIGSEEDQAVYISGNIGEQVAKYRKARNKKEAQNAPLPQRKEKELAASPDVLSSTLKRMVPQLIRKGSIIIKAWGGKQAVVLQDHLLNDFSSRLSFCAREEAEVIWIPLVMIFNKKLNRNIFEAGKPRYTRFSVISDLLMHEAGDLQEFLKKQNFSGTNDEPF